jgi:hypothetical protein
LTPGSLPGVNFFPHTYFRPYNQKGLASAVGPVGI